MSTLKYFILIVVAFVIAVIFLAGPSPFSFGEAYFRPRNNPSPAAVAEPSYIPLPPNASPAEIQIDR